MKAIAGGIVAGIFGLGWALVGGGVNSTARAIYAEVPAHRSSVIEAFTVANRDCTRQIFGNVPAIMQNITGKIFVATVDFAAAKRGEVPDSSEIDALKHRQLPQIEDRLRASADSFTNEQIAAMEKMINDKSSADKFGKCVVEQAYENLKAQGIIRDENL